VRFRAHCDDRVRLDVRTITDNQVPAIAAALGRVASVATS